MDVTLPLVRTRLAAHILDVLLIGVVGLAIGWAISRLVQQGPPAGPDPANPGRLPPLVDTAIWLLLDAGYFLYTWHARGRTLRMRALGLWVADAADGRRLSYRQGAIRWAVVNLETLVAIALGLVVSLGFAETIAAWAWLLVLLGSTARSAANQGLHDRAAGSIVTAGSPGRLGAGALQPRRRTGAPSAPGTTAPSRMWSRERGALVGALTSTPLCLLLLGLALIRSTEGTPWDSLTLVAFVALTAGPGAGALFAPAGSLRDSPRLPLLVVLGVAATAVVIGVLLVMVLAWVVATVTAEPGMAQLAGSAGGGFVLLVLFGCPAAGAGAPPRHRVDLADAATGRAAPAAGRGLAPPGCRIGAGSPMRSRDRRMEMARPRSGGLRASAPGRR